MPLCAVCGPQIETLGALSVSALLIAGGGAIGYHSYLYVAMWLPAHS